MFAIDTGSDGASGPFFQWSARGSQDGQVSARTFYIRDGSQKTNFDAETKPIILDIEGMKTGWQKSEGIAGVAPEWKWNASVNQMMPQPSEDFKKGFSMRVAIGGGEAASWEQAGAAVWQCLTDLAPKLAQQPAKGMLPVVKLVEVKNLQFKRGSTAAPVLEIVKWVETPDCLKQGAAAGIATDPTPAPAPQPAPQPAPSVAPAALDDVEF